MSFSTSVLGLTSAISFTRICTDITNLKLLPYKPSIYTTPFCLDYWQNRAHHQMNVFQERESVSIIIYNKTRKVLVFVRQFRPSVYAHEIQDEDIPEGGEISLEDQPPDIAVTLEFCAGLADKPNVPLVNVAQEEVLEECGYNVPVEEFEVVHCFSNGVTTTGNFQTMYYVEVTDEMKVNDGGGVDDEVIDVVELSVNDAKKYATFGDIMSPSTLAMGVFWFVLHKYEIDENDRDDK